LVSSSRKGWLYQTVRQGFLAISCLVAAFDRDPLPLLAPPGANLGRFYLVAALRGAHPNISPFRCKSLADHFREQSLRKWVNGKGEGWEKVNSEGRKVRKEEGA
jgi:hypothetical protein